MTAHTTITAQDVSDRGDVHAAVYVAQLEHARRNLTLDECRKLIGDQPHRFGFHTYSPEAMTDALFAIAGGRVTKVGL